MLKLLGKIYGGVADARNLLYDRGIFKTHSLGARTISIGNLTAGGTGKTPLVAYVAEILADRGEKVCILTRGYGRKNPASRVLVSDWENVLADAPSGGDEPVELARKLVGKAIVIADSDRVAAAKWTKDRFGITAFVLDDGFQHRRAHRDLDIVCVDATKPSEWMLPFGSLREPLPNLRRADVIVFTRSDLVDRVATLVSQAATLNPTAKIFTSRMATLTATPLSTFLKSNRSEPNLNPRVTCFAFCGLGNPNAFFDALRSAKYRLEATRAFRDHHFYTKEDLYELQAEAVERRVEALITTPKDAVKLEGLKLEFPCYVIESEVTFDDVEGFRELVTSS
ncbi:MAG: tetraacyldisaccharide 4'-kinase [Pyrinomonadaceae bacterium]